MAPLWTLLSVFFSIIITPFLMFLLAIIFLASIGKSLGVRRLYVKMLLKLFEYGRQHIEIARDLRREQARDAQPCGLLRSDRQAGAEDDGDRIDGDRIDGAHGEADMANREAGNGQVVNGELGHGKAENGEVGNGKAVNGELGKPPACKGAANGSIANGCLPHGGHGLNVISREDLILAPDPGCNSVYGQGLPRSRSFETLKREFALSDCLDYVKAGVESIIEDEVTLRFEAEELKSWNLLTRTNRWYEFVSWRLTILWVTGFMVRYFFLLPLRILICFVGVIFCACSMATLAFLPPSAVKRWLHRQAYVMTFRIFARCLSMVLTYHNIQYRPDKGGVCVANHTSPIDIITVSTESCFSLVMWLTLCTGIVGYVPEGPFKRWLNHRVSIMCFGVLSSALSSVITYHNPENKPKNGICVANHTSPIDVLVLACDNCYALIGQRHGGFLGVLQRALARASPHIWFERSEVKDREAVAKRLRQHVSDPNNPPILIFPEGTCINNTSVMQFKKGSFEVGGVIYPVAIKYDAKFGDAFWNSSRFSMMQYLYMMMTSWAIVCDVWYLPPMYQQENESAIDFANRVKSCIARQGGLVDLMWDGQLKRMKAKKEWKEKQQEEFSKRLKVD